MIQQESSVYRDLLDYDIDLSVTEIRKKLSSGLPSIQFYGSGFAIAYRLKNRTLIHVLEIESQNAGLSNLYFTAKTAATLMAMNNIYYRAIHLAKHQ